jgi:carbon storage regulator
MLVVTREAGQAVRIGRDIEVRIVDVRGRRVRVAVAAPKRVPVLRGELGESRSSHGGTTTAPTGENR